MTERMFNLLGNLFGFLITIWGLIALGFVTWGLFSMNFAMVIVGLSATLGLAGLLGLAKVVYDKYSNKGRTL